MKIIVLLKIYFGVLWTVPQGRERQTISPDVGAPSVTFTSSQAIKVYVCFCIGCVCVHAPLMIPPTYPPTHTLGVKPVHQSPY